MSSRISTVSTMPDVSPQGSTLRSRHDHARHGSPQNPRAGRSQPITDHESRLRRDARRYKQRDPEKYRRLWLQFQEGVIKYIETYGEDGPLPRIPIARMVLDLPSLDEFVELSRESHDPVGTFNRIRDGNWDLYRNLCSCLEEPGRLLDIDIDHMLALERATRREAEGERRGSNNHGSRYELDEWVGARNIAQLEYRLANCPDDYDEQLRRRVAQRGRH